MNNHTKYMSEAVKEALQGIQNDDGGPFGCIVVKNDKIVGRGHNLVTSTNDPTAHGEITAIRDACKNLNSFQLDGCIIYTSCEPCPMCLGAIYWSRAEKVYYGCNQKDAAKIGFDDEFIYKEIGIKKEDRKIPFIQIERETAIKAFEQWEVKENRIDY